MESLWKIIIITLIIVILAGFVVILTHPQYTARIEITPGSDRQINRIGVYGAVKHPGLFSYEGDIRIGDAVELAGGYTSDADIIYSNAAQWVEDGETIIIPTVSSLQPTLTPPVPEEQKVDLNTAGKAELMKLPGIGEKRAEEIIKLREKQGRIKAKEDLLQIQGISEKLLESIYDNIIVE